MKNRLILLSIACVLGLSSCKTQRVVQKTDSPIIEKKEISSEVQTGNTWVAAENEKLIFPDEWLGYWKGELEIYDHSGLKQTIPMALENALTDKPGEYIWAIIYGADSIEGRRDYKLLEIDKTKGHYVTDEQNGIFIDSYVVHNELVSVFEVMGNMLTSSYKREGDNLIFEIMMFKSKEINTTGDTIINGEEIPTVKSYPVKVKQKAILQKIRN